jgi:ATP-dependent Clp protease ATP-binding subunit ClpC
MEESHLRESRTLTRVYDEATSLCKKVGKRDEPQSFYLLMALFTTENPTGDFLRAHGIEEPLLLDHFPKGWIEPSATGARLRQQAKGEATRLGDEWTNSYHLLLAIIADTEGRARIALEAAAEQRRVSLRKLRQRCYKLLSKHRLDLLAKATGAQAQRALGSRPPTSASRLPERIGTATFVPFDIDPIEPATLLPHRLESSTPTLDSLCVDMVAQARGGALNAVLGRDGELAKMMDVLGKRQANNPLIVGPSGVGKTALVEGLALAIAEGQAGPLNERRLMALEVGSLLAGTALRGSLSERLTALRREVSGGGTIVFIDELHSLMGTGAEGGNGAADELKSALARGELPCIGATTEEEYQRHIAKDPALARRFTPIFLAEPEPEEAEAMIRGSLPAYESHHGCSFADESVRAAVRLSHRYISQGALPAKAFDLLDLAASRSVRRGDKEVSRRAVAEVVAEAVRMPVERIDGGDEERLLGLEYLLAERVVGRDPALASIAQTLRRNHAGFGGRRPIGSFLLLGPTGVGKTEVARALSEVLFGSADEMLRFDMGEFTESHSVARLIGAPPGYVGHEEGGQLTESVRRKPYRVLLFDEIEKAHHDVQQVLLSLLDEGSVSDGRGMRVSFRHTLVIMTSNLGATRASERRIGFGAGSEAPDAQQGKALIEGARSALPPELFGRIDEVLAFPMLSASDAAQIAERLLKASLERLSDERGIVIEFDAEVIAWLVDQGFTPADGARPLRRLVQREVEGLLSEAVLKGEIKAGMSGALSVVDQTLQVSCAAPL